MLTWLNIAAAIVWAVAFIKLAPATSRWLLGRAREDDGFRAVLFFVAANSLGYLARWAAFHSTEHLSVQDWRVSFAMRLLSLLCGVFTIAVSRGYRHAQRG